MDEKQPLVMFFLGKEGEAGSMITVPPEHLTPEMVVLQYFLTRPRQDKEGPLTPEDGWAMGRLQELVLKESGPLQH